MTTAQTLIDEARAAALNDSTKDRYSDAELLVGLNDGLKLIRAVRPDLWFGSLATPLASLALGDTFPLAPEYEQAIKKYVVHHAEMRDDEYAVKGRAESFLKQFVAEISQG